MLRREITGNVVSTGLSANMAFGATTFTVLNGTSFPTGATAPFVVVIDRGLSTEEKMLITSRSANTFTVQTRAYDGTLAYAHNTSAAVDHVLDATTIQDMNTTTYDSKLLLWVNL